MRRPCDAMVVQVSGFPDSNGEAGASPALSRNCNPAARGSQVARLYCARFTLVVQGVVHGEKSEKRQSHLSGHQRGFSFVRESHRTKS